MAAVRLGLGVIRFSQLDGREIGGVGPVRFTGNHLPPYAHVLHRVNPAHVFQDARVVQVQDEARSQHVGGLLTHLHRTPGAHARSLEAGFDALGVRGKGRAEHHFLVVQQEAGGGIIQYAGLVQVDVEAFVRLHLQGCLYGGGADIRLRRVVRTVCAVDAADFRQAGLVVVVLLGVVVSADPPGGVVPGEGEFRQFIGHLEIGELVLHGELVAEAQAVVVQAEADVHPDAVLAGELEEHLVVAVADVIFLAPDGRPGFVEGAIAYIVQLKAILKVDITYQVIAQAGRQDYVRLAVLEGIHGDAVQDVGAKLQRAVRALKRVAVQGFHLGSGAGGKRQNA